MFLLFCLGKPLRKSVFIAITILTACGKGETKPQPSPSISDDLQLKRTLYLELIKGVQDGDGFVEHDSCDSLLWSGLSGAGGADLDIVAARETGGRWLRRPTSYPECYANGMSKSTISRDMLLGVIWYSVNHSDMRLVEDLWSYAKAHNYKMGDGVPSRVYLTPNFQRTIAAMADDSAFKTLPDIWSKVQDFEAHVQVLHILLRGHAVGAITGEMAKLVDYQAHREPENALFQFAYHYYTDGNQQTASEILANEDYFPKDRLPAAQDRCNGWLWERDFGSNWKPCDIERVHSGGDFLFLTWLINKASEDTHGRGSKAFGFLLQ